MVFRVHRLGKRALTALMVVFLAGLAFRSASTQPTPRSIFLSEPQTSYRESPGSLEQFSKRGRNIRIDREALSNLAGGGQVRLRLDLFSDAVFNATVTRVRRRSPTRYVLSGNLENQTLGNFTIAVYEDAVCGNVQTDDGALFQIRTSPSGEPEVREYQAPPNITCGNAEAPPGRARVQTSTPLRERSILLDAGTPNAEPSILTESEPRVSAGHDLLAKASLYVRSHSSRSSEPIATEEAQLDVLVVYTPAARSNEGGTSAMNALIDLAEYETNQGYQNSYVPATLEVVARQEINYTETNAFDDRDALLAGEDGLGSVHTLRNNVDADMVVMITHWEDTGIAGIAAAIPDDLDELFDFEDKAFCLLDHREATGGGAVGYVFGHETAHLMGCAHPTSGVELFYYSHGINTGFTRTIVTNPPGPSVSNHYSDGGSSNRNADSLAVAVFAARNWRGDDEGFISPDPEVALIENGEIVFALDADGNFYLNGQLSQNAFLGACRETHLHP